MASRAIARHQQRFDTLPSIDNAARHAHIRREPTPRTAGVRRGFLDTLPRVSSQPATDSNGPAPYGSAADLPSFRELSQQIVGGKLLTRLVFRQHHSELVEIEQHLEHLTRVVDAFYDRLGSRNWIFHETLSLKEVERILAETPDAASAEQQLIELYRNGELGDWKLMRLRSHEGLLRRLHQIERAREHYQAGQYDSCVLHLIASWTASSTTSNPKSAKAYTPAIPAHGCLEQHRGPPPRAHTHHGYLHQDDQAPTRRRSLRRVPPRDHARDSGQLQQPIVATKAWNMLFAVSDWATATEKAKQPKEPKPTLSDTRSELSRHASYRKHQREFVPVTVQAADAGFETDEVAKSASDFLEAWEHRRWGHVARFQALCCGARSLGA